MEDIETTIINVLRKGKKMEIKVGELRDGDIVQDGDDRHMVHCLVREHTFYRDNGEGYLIEYNFSDRPRSLEIRNGCLATLHDFMWLDLVPGSEDYKFARYMLDRAKIELDNIKKEVAA